MFTLQPLKVQHNALQAAVQLHKMYFLTFIP